MSLALIFRMVVRLQVTEMEWCLAVVVLFDAWREIGRDGVCEHATDLISQRRLCHSDGRLYQLWKCVEPNNETWGFHAKMKRRARATENLMNFELKGSTSLLLPLKRHSSR